MCPSYGKKSNSKKSRASRVHAWIRLNMHRLWRRLMNQRVMWACMSKDVTEWVKDCQACSRAKVTSQPAAAVQPIPVPQQRFSHIHVDFVGPLTVSKEGFRYLFTIIDRSSRWLEAIPLATMETDTCVEALISSWIARFGIPAIITSDRGSQFTSSIWAATCQQHRPLPDRVAAIAAHPRLTNIRELQNFLGVINFYTSFRLKFQ